jgi:ABC-type transport system involved in multi-copper enzyme maturation permease subunit
LNRLIDVEFFKLRKRMMTWVCALVLVGMIILLYSVLWNVSGEATRRFGFGGRFSAEDLRRTLFIQYSVPFSLQVVGYFGAILAVVFSAGAAGGEYGWGTVRLMATSAPGRIKLIVAKMVVVSIMTLAGAAIAVIVGLSYSGLITWSSGGADLDFLTWQFLYDQALAYVRTVFVLSPYVFMAFCIAVVARSTLAGVGAGLGVAAVGPLIAGLMREGGEPWRSLPDYFIHRNAEIILAQNVVPRPLPQFGPSLNNLARNEAFSPETAALILSVYVFVFVATSLIVFSRRDIAAG